MTDVGATLGVEEEYHLVDPDTLALAPTPELSAAVSEGHHEPQLRAEMLTSQLEAVTDVCASLTELRTSLVAARRAAADRAAAHGTVLLATSTHPFAELSEIDIARRVRYERLLERFGVLPRQLNLTGCHVHVGVGDLDVAVRVLTLARPYLPLLVAMTASSPFHAGVDSGFASYRSAALAVWPQGGTPPALRNAEEYRTVVAGLQRAGLIDDPSTLLWELRPSTRYPTLEFRVPDICPDLDDAVLLAGVVRSLTSTLARRSATAGPPGVTTDAVLPAARWRGARYGLDGELWSPSRRQLVPARQAVRDLVEEIRDDLTERGDQAIVAELLEQLLARGSSASRQRAIAARTGGDLRAVARDGVGLTVAAIS